MATVDLEKQYDRILEESRQRGEVQEEPDGKERRKYPRLRVNPGNLPVEIDPWVFAIDVSISGMAFYSDTPVDIGEIVNLSLTEEEIVEARVVDAHMEKSHSPFVPSRYRLHCEFIDEKKGKKLLVKIKEMENTGTSSRNT